jgi:hypothetical protein
VTGRWIWERCDGCDFSQRRSAGEAPMTLSAEDRARLTLLVDQSGRHLTVGDVHDRLRVADRTEAEVRATLACFIDLEYQLAGSLGVASGTIVRTPPAA